MTGRGGYKGGGDVTRKGKTKGEKWPGGKKGGGEVTGGKYPRPVSWYVKRGTLYGSKSEYIVPTYPHKPEKKKLIIFSICSQNADSPL